MSQVAAMTRESGSMKGTKGGSSSRLGILERASWGWSLPLMCLKEGRVFQESGWYWYYALGIFRVWYQKILLLNIVRLTSAFRQFGRYLMVTQVVLAELISGALLAQNHSNGDVESDSNPSFWSCLSCYCFAAGAPGTKTPRNVSCLHLLGWGWMIGQTSQRPPAAVFKPSQIQTMPNHC